MHSEGMSGRRVRRCHLWAGMVLSIILDLRMLVGILLFPTPEDSDSFRILRERERAKWLRVRGSADDGKRHNGGDNGLFHVAMN